MDESRLNDHHWSGAATSIAANGTASAADEAAVGRLIPFPESGRTFTSSPRGHKLRPFMAPTEIPTLMTSFALSMKPKKGINLTSALLTRAHRRKIPICFPVDVTRIEQMGYLMRSGVRNTNPRLAFLLSFGRRNLSCDCGVRMQTLGGEDFRQRAAEPESRRA